MSETDKDAAVDTATDASEPTATDTAATDTPTGDSSPSEPTKPDDNAALAQALEEALQADETASQVSTASEQQVQSITAEIEAAKERAASDVQAAQQRASDARAAATSQWNEFYTRLKDRARRSPVRGGPIGNLLTVVLVALAASMFAGCGASELELKNLRAEVRFNEGRLHDLEALDGKIAAAAVEELSAAVKAQTAELTKHSEQRSKEAAAFVNAIEQQTVVSPCPCAVGEPQILPLPAEEVHPAPTRPPKASKGGCR